MKSMTAFGRATASANGKNIICEIKSVNNRFFDCTVKLPRAYSFLEEKVTALIREKGIVRGKLDVYIGIELTDTLGTVARPDMDYVASYIAALREINENFGLGQDQIPLSMIASNSNAIINSKAEQDEQNDWEDLRPVLEEAIKKFDFARTAEGERLKTDLLGKKENLRKLAARIGEKSAEDIRSYRAKLESRLKKTLADLDVELSPDRVLTEVAVFADKVAIDEELVRLASHFEAFDTILASDEPAGRKLDFLVQEMNREVNTTGSKACDAEIAQLVVEAKCELEKIREQIQNLE